MKQFARSFTRISRTRSFCKQPFHISRRTMGSTTAFDKNPTVQLNETETKISTLLKDFTNEFNSQNKDGEKLELRITGGWVRDKLLGDESNDLDIAINKLTGEEFGENLREFLISNFDKYKVSPKSIHKIDKNPAKSKHLETATTKLYGLDVDFVNLRSEEYTDESRIPIIKYGTPQEDALRRDATLNALFYNLQKDQVEDLTGRGLEDLRDGVLRTPLDPLKTFLDDPLRVLRLIRFASRFGFSIEEGTFNAMKDESIKAALVHKISRERVGVEVGKTLQGNDPIYGLELIKELGLFRSIFNFGPFEEDVYKHNDETMLNSMFDQVDIQASNAINAVKNFSNNTNLDHVFNHVSQNKELKMLLWLSLISKPWGAQKVFFNARKEAFATELIVKEGVKLSKLDADTVTRLVTTSSAYQKVVMELPNYQRSVIGVLLKQYGENLNLSLVFNFFSEVSENGQVEHTLAKYEAFYDLILKENLQGSYKLKPIVDGKTLLKRLNAKPGPWMGKLTEKILVWQLDNPDKGQEECIEYAASILPDLK